MSASFHQKKAAWNPGRFIITFFRDEANRSTDIRVRSRRRKDEHSIALARHQELLFAPREGP